MKIKTINLTGEETKAELNRAYAFIEINNSSDGEILISKEPGIVRGNDDVAILPAKNIVTIGDAGSSTGIKEIYISGKGEIQIIGKDFAEHCFKAPASGGGSDENIPAALKFLPHPENISAFFDYENGIDEVSQTWTDLISGFVAAPNYDQYGQDVFTLTKDSKGLIITIAGQGSAIGDGENALFLNNSSADDCDYIFYCILEQTFNRSIYMPIGHVTTDRYTPGINTVNGNISMMTGAGHGVVNTNVSVFNKPGIVSISNIGDSANLYVNGQVYASTARQFNRTLSVYTLASQTYYKCFIVQKNIALTYEQIIANQKALAQKYGIEI